MAALVVALYHFSYQGRLGPPLVRVVLGHGYMAVDLFFVLSGFVLALTYAERFRAGFEWRVYADYLGRRLARVYPLYVVLTLACCLIAFAGYNTLWPGARPELEKLAVEATMLQCLGGGYSIDIAAWSISTEFVASLAFPVLCVVALYRGPAPAIALGAICVLVIALLSLVPDSWTPGTYRAARMAWLNHYDAATPYALYRCLADFTLGLLAWRLYASSCGAWLCARSWPGYVLSGVVAGLLCVRNVDALTVSLLPCLVLGLAASRSGPSRLLGARGFEMLGLISYSLYLVHMPVYDILDPVASRLSSSRVPITLLDLFASLGVACVTYTVIEKPGRRLGRRLVGKVLGGPRQTI